MINTPIPVLIILTTYLLFVFKIGPNVMAYREPYNATTLLRIYDIVQIGYNMYFVFSVSMLLRYYKTNEIIRISFVYILVLSFDWTAYLL